VTTTIKHSPALTPSLIRLHSGVEAALRDDPPRCYLDHQILVIDDVQWQADLGVIRAGLDPRRRAFKAPFIERSPSAQVKEEVRNVLTHAAMMFSALYPDFEVVPGAGHESFRPMVTGPEPLHFDTYGGKPMVTAYINVSDEPRVYRLSYNFQQLADKHPTMLLAAWGERKAPIDDASYPLRRRTERGLPPLGPNAPRHEVHLTPGAIWFFDAKTVSHEVVHGTGAVCIGWEVPNCGSRTQRDILQSIL
jgi:hypothetical protein